MMMMMMMILTSPCRMWRKKGMQLISVNSDMGTHIVHPAGTFNKLIHPAGYMTRAAREVTSALEKV